MRQVIPGSRAGKGAALIVMLAALGLFSAGGSGGSYQVRVKIMDLSGAVTVSGQGLAWKAGGKQGRGRSVVVTSSGRGLKLDNKTVKAPLLFSADSIVSVDGVEYRGMVKVIDDPAPLIINVLDVESYVAGVINHEIDSRWPEAAVDAQAILARTYAMRRSLERRDRPYDLDRTVTDQVYGGVPGEDELAWAAVRRTSGLVMAYQGELASGLYHSCCGGKTELPSQVWGGVDRPYEKSVECRYCQDAPRYFWRFPETGAISGAELAKFVGAPGEITGVVVTEKTSTGRMRMIEFTTGRGAMSFTGNEFRKRIGYTRIFSTAVQPDREDGGFVFRGSGSGHGVGLCQWGARGMALAGFASGRILGYYFPGAEVVNLSGLKLR